MTAITQQHIHFLFVDKNVNRLRSADYKVVAVRAIFSLARNLRNLSKHTQLRWATVWPQ